jgi:predicted metalloprotease
MTLCRLMLVLAAAFAVFASPAGAAERSGAEVVEWSAEQLDAWYMTLFALQGQEYTAPELVLVEDGKTARSACGEFSGERIAAYCTLDATIYLGVPFVEALAAEDEAVPAFVLAHEWSHHVQTISGAVPHGEPALGDWNQTYVIEHELRADCMAGAWFASLDHRGYLDASDMSAVLATAYEIGDAGMFGRGFSHGTGEERIRAVFTGYTDGLVACGTITPLERVGGVPLMPHPISAGPN